ncbi:glycosyltransferase, partial [Candidatus Roizmanbacteria bacterium]|nr:glycosyltransferase [Candidatus Roizmanbacteria bacterium]
MISIIIPFYNEAESLPILMNQLIGVCKKVKESWEIILVDDGSIDNSPNELSKLKVNPEYLGKKLKIISQRKRFGKGKALLTGFQESKG